MANETDNNIVIECSPYGDSEIEILNLKSPSYEIISMPNIFDYEKSLNIFITITIALLGLTIIFLFLKIVVNPSKFVKSDSCKMFLYLLYFILFIVGAMISGPQDSEDLTILYATFGVVVVLVIGIRLLQVNNIFEIPNVIFPGPGMITNANMNIVYFVFLLVGLYLIISGIRSMNDIQYPFSPATGLVTSYCFLQILNFIVINTKSSIEDSNNPSINSQVNPFDDVKSRKGETAVRNAVSNDYYTEDVAV